jgi:hypothetical protein
VKRAIAAEVERIDYPNFKNSVADVERHDAYEEVWDTMLRWGHGYQRARAFGGVS